MYDNIKSVELYRYNDQYYLRLKYIVNGSDNKKYELFIPRVRLPIENLPVTVYSDINLGIEPTREYEILYPLKEIVDG